MQVALAASSSPPFSAKDRLQRAGIATALQQHVQLEHFAGAVPGAGDEGEDRLIGQGAVHRVPVGVGVDDHRTAHRQVGGEHLIPVGGGVSKGVACNVAGKDDAVVTDAHLDDVGHAIGGAGFDLGCLDGAAGVRHVDGVFANTFAEPSEPGRGATQFDHRCGEIEVFGKEFGNDGRIGKHRR